MIRVATYEQGLAEEKRQREEVDAPAKAITDSLAEESVGFKTALSARIDKDWQANKQNKTQVERIMLDCLLDRKGEYNADEKRLIAEGGGSDIYMPVATSKVRTGIAHIKAIYLTAGHASHGIKPTPKPELPTELQQAIISRIVSNPKMLDEQGQKVDPMDQVDMLTAMARREMEQMSREAARRHEKVINDQLIEGGFYKQLSIFVEDLCTYPAAFMKGPYFAMQPRLSWQRDAQMKMKPVQEFSMRPQWRAINPFDAYPAPGVDSVQKGAFVERLRMKRSDLYRMRDAPGYNKQAVLDALAEAEAGSLTDWLWTDSARAKAADHAYFWMKSSTDLDGLHWYDVARGVELLEWGMDPRLIDDPLDFYEVDAILVGRHVVRASLNPDPMYRRAIHSTCYEKIPGTVFGNSISMLMKSSQRMINATARSLQNNLAYSSGFQTEVNHARISPETDLHDMHPFKIWQAEESEVASNGAPAVRFFQPASNASELMAVIDVFKRATDMDTGIPEFLSGGESHGTDTARGQAMLEANGAKLLRSSITNVDEDVIVPGLELLYTHNMLNHPDESIKGDCQIEARGANAILQRETSRQQHMAMLELTNNPQDAAIIGLKGRATLLKNIFGTFEGADAEIIPEGEEFDKLIADLSAQQSQQPPDPQVIRAQMQQQTDQAKLALEEKRMMMDAKANDPAQVERLKGMELASRERVEQAKLDKGMQDEVVKYRAERMAERQKAQLDVVKAKLEAETKARIRVAELKLEQKAKREDRDSSERVAMAGIPKEAANEPALSGEDIKAAVEATVVPMLSTFQSETMAVIKELTAKLAEEQSKGPPTIHVNVDAGQPTEKTVRATRGADGTLTGTITSTPRKAS